MLDREFNVHHATHAVFDVKHASACGVGLANLLAHGADFLRQGGCIAFGGDDSFAHRIEALTQGVGFGARGRVKHAAGPCHGLVLPSPGGVAAALLLVVGERAKAADQHPRVAVGPQRGVDFKQVAFTRFDRQPVDELAHKGRVDFTGVVVFVVEHKHNVQVAAIAQFFAAQFAVPDDGKSGLLAVAVFQAAPTPLCGHAQHRVGQCREVVGHLFDGDDALHIARQGAENLRMVCAAQQIEQGFVIVLARALQ